MSSIASIAIPVASPVPSSAPVVKRRVLKVKPVVAAFPAPVEEVVEEVAPVEEKVIDVEVMVKKSEYDALLARVAALESKKRVERVVKEKQPPKSAVRVSTKDAVLRDILNDGEKVYAKELINDGDEKGEYRTWCATFHRAHNGFLIDECDNERVWTTKRMYAMSPTTLCSRFRYLMAENGESLKSSSTCCGFAKCYVMRDDVMIRLANLL